MSKTQCVKTKEHVSQIGRTLLSSVGLNAVLRRNFNQGLNYLFKGFPIWLFELLLPISSFSIQGRRIMANEPIREMIERRWMYHLSIGREDREGR